MEVPSTFRCFLTGQLEVLLGLWLWSLKCDPIVETSDPHTHFIRSRATEILARRIIAATPLASAQITSGSGVNTDLKLWLDDGTISFSEDELKLDRFGDASTLFMGDEVLRPTSREGRPVLEGQAAIRMECSKLIRGLLGIFSTNFHQLPSRVDPFTELALVSVFRRSSHRSLRPP